MDQNNGWISLPEFAGKVSFTDTGIKHRIKNGQIKKFKKIKTEGGVNRYFVHESELINFQKNTNIPDLELKSEEKGEWLSVTDFVRKCGRSRANIHGMLTDGKIKKSKKEKQPYGAGWKWLVHESELEQFKNLPPTRKYGKKIISMPKFTTDIPKISEDVDVNFDAVMNFIPENGKYPYKNLCMAVKMAIERKDWNDITIQTGVPQKQVIVLIEEFKEAVKKEPKKFTGLMAYLNAGRPYNYNKRDLLAKD